VATQEDLGGGSPATVPPVWHRAGAGLAGLLDRVLPGTDGAGQDGAVAPRPAAAPALETVAATGRADRTSPLLVAGAALGGLALGVAATLLAPRLLGGRPA
jgi:hypothetical protein